MTNRAVIRTASSLLFFSLLPVAVAQAQDLKSFGVVAGQSLTNTGPTTIVGNIALSPGTSYTGSGSVTQTGETFLADAVAVRIQNDLTTLYAVLKGRPTSIGGNLTGQDLGGKTLTPGVYNFDSSASLASGQTLTLDGGGDPNALFIFNIGSTLTAGSGSTVVLQNGAQGGNVFYRIGSSATLDTTADLAGQIVALTSITMNTQASLGCGAALARNGSVTLDTNTIQICTLSGDGFDGVIDDGSLTANERRAAVALSDFVASGGVLPIGFAILAATQTPAELADSLVQMSGEVSTGVAPMALRSMDAFLDTIMRPSLPLPVQSVAPRDVGLPAGMVRESINTPYTGKYGPSEPAPLAYSPDSVLDTSTWQMWVDGYGSRTVIDGDVDLGYHELTTSNSGLAVGLNYAENGTTDFGVALSWNTADFSLSDDLGTGTSDTIYIALRGRTATDRAYVEGALAYGQSDITTDRTLTIAGADRYTGETTADTIAAHLEAGYRMGAFTPFAGLRAKSITTDAFSETTASGSSSFALHYDEQTARSVRSELGVAVGRASGLAGLDRTGFGFRAAWAHEFASNDPGTRSFLTTPGVVFPVSGATPNRDSLILSANAGIAYENGISIDGEINVEYASNLQDYGGSITLAYRW